MLPLPSVVAERRGLALPVSEPRVVRVAPPWVRTEEQKQPALRVWRRWMPAKMAQPAEQLAELHSRPRKEPQAHPVPPGTAGPKSPRLAP